MTGWGSKQKIVSYQTTKEENIFMSYKIFRVLNGVVSIASSDGTFFNVPEKDFDFEPQKGDVVQCFKNGERMIINKQTESLSSQVVKGSMTDPRDGKVYETVEIGSHIWLAENLSYKTSDSLCYDNDEENAKKYGRLYKFGDAKNACPPGWHLPSSNEIESLVHAVGGMSIAGKSLKSVSGWQSEEGQSKKNLDSVGFSALPAGYYVTEDDPEENYFDGIGEVSSIWFDSGEINLYHDCDYVDYDECVDDFCSVRCVKDETYYKIIRVVNGVASVASNSGDVFNISVNELDFEPKTGDEVLCFKNGEQILVVAKNFVPAKTGTNDQSQDNPKDAFKIIRVLNGVASVASSSGDVLNVPVDELDFDPKAGDEVQCFRKGENVIVFKNNLNPHSKNTVSKNESQGIVQNTPIDNPFAEDAVEKKSKVPWIVGIILLLVGVLFACLYLKNSNVGTMTDSRDGKKYKTVKIGSQIWMAENLNYRTRDSYCYEDKISNCDKYGRLYTWDAAITACPSGWHLPTHAEWETLVTAVGGESGAGTKLKSTSGWLKDGNGSDSFGFSALPAGERHLYPAGSGPEAYTPVGHIACFWSSTDKGRYYTELFAERDDVWINNPDDRGRGKSVRCLKN